MTDRYLREELKAQRRGRPAETGIVADMLRELWSDRRTTEARRLVCVPFGDYNCQSFDDVVLDTGDTSVSELRAQLVAAVGHTVAIRRALDAARSVRDAVLAAHRQGYAPAVRTPRNALLPESVLGLSDVVDDEDRSRYLARLS